MRGTMDYMSKLIGITAGEIVNKARPWSPITYGQSYSYVDAIIHSGGTPIIIPLTDDKKTLREIYDNLGGILFTGGNDIDPRLYGEEPTEKSVDVSVFRDQTEVQLMKWALEDGKPILCICRGMELLNVVNGGTLYQDVLSELDEKNDHDSSSKAEDIEYLAHNLEIDPGSKLAKILGATQIPTNTHHHQAVKDVAPNYKVTAKAEDNIVEAIEPINEGGTYVIGVQSHPESLEKAAEPGWRKLFSSFVEAVDTSDTK